MTSYLSDQCFIPSVQLRCDPPSSSANQLASILFLNMFPLCLSLSALRPFTTCAPSTSPSPPGSRGSSVEHQHQKHHPPHVPPTVSELPGDSSSLLLRTTSPQRLNSLLSSNSQFVVPRGNSWRELAPSKSNLTSRNPTFI